MGVVKVIVNGTTKIDITPTTATASDVASTKIFFNRNGEQTVGTSSGGSATLITKTITANGTYNASSDNADGYSSVTASVPDAFTITDTSNTTGTTAVITAGTGGGATQHTIHFEFSDSTDTDIEVYYDDALIGTMITAYAPSGWTYNNKIVDSAALDNVTWYTRPTVIWETLYDNNMNWIKDNDNDYPYCWVTELGNTQIPVGSNWRVTYNNTQYLCTADANGKIGNPVWGRGTDNGSDAPFVFENLGYGAWTGSLNVPNVDSQYYFIIERQVTE